ncbi:High-affinity glucose transporter ght2 [Colletotrichum aenigma]|uniref:High-affinity glucose transporter ght2 n=1 Tax=Colletotrichum aenigma TaxID=1215731 RepID=UPI0018729D72|nr:High-affinity glucose transporter ght2 [Colletotrichum aenigma]KAF5527870.1 High-affinity glucose transporter ght2 [Colletotrichum aenigma]
MLAQIKNDPLYQDLNWRLMLIGCVANLGAMGFGFDNGWWGGALGLSQFQKKYGEYDDALGRYAIPATKTSVGTGTGSAGIIIGCILAPFVTSRFGRKKSFLVISALMGTGVVLESSAVTSFWQLVVGRIMVYAGMGLASNLTPMYLSECSPPRIRGAFLALYSFFLSFGVFMAAIAVYLSRTRNDQWQYLIVILCQLFVPLGYVVMKLSNHPETIAQEVQLLKIQVEEQRELHKATSLNDCFKGVNLRRTIIAMSQLGFPDSLRTNVMVTGCGFAVHFITFLTFDKLGRRRSLSLGAVLLAGMMLGTGAATATGSAGHYSSAVAKAAAALLILWYSIYGITWGPGCWVVAGEIGTGQLREKTLFLTSMGSFLTSVPINFVNPYVQAKLGGGVTFIYGAFSVVAAIWVFLMVPETKNRSLEDLDEMFQANVKTREFKKYVSTGLGAQITMAEDKGAKKMELEQEEDA